VPLRAQVFEQQALDGEQAGQLFAVLQQQVAPV
jgi:hypothetical protein